MGRRSPSIKVLRIFFENQTTAIRPTVHFTQAYKVPIVGRIIQKFSRAVENEEKFTKYFSELSASAPKAKVKEWAQEIELAKSQRIRKPEAMDVMNARVPQAAGLVQTASTLVDQEERGTQGLVSWIRTGLRLEDTQVEIAYLVRKGGVHPNVEDRTRITAKRDTLVKQIDKFNALSERYLGLHAMER
ncbi:hypothetical protein CPB83DRAFT_841281, partial [Crepidotus variabilis]